LFACGDNHPLLPPYMVKAGAEALGALFEPEQRAVFMTA
jgi:hypothetical protein